VKTGKKIAEILTEEGKVFPLFGLMDGFVIEINEEIQKNPNIILDYVRNFFFTRMIPQNFSFFHVLFSILLDTIFN
jgi:glycine cleavage system H lipoate-binding protein